MRSPRRGKVHGEGETPDFRTIQTLHNHFPNHPATAFQPCANHREPQPIFIRPSTATQPRDNHSHASFVLQSHSSRPKPTDGRSRAWQTPTAQPSFVSKPRTIPTQPSHIRDSSDPTTSSCMALARPSTASVAASLPALPAARRRSPSCWQWCHERCRRRESQTLVK